MHILGMELEYFIDYVGNRIHILEKSASINKQLFNTISPDFQKQLVEEQFLLTDVLDFDWILYDLNGLIVAYTDYNMKLVNRKMPFVHEPYIEAARKHKFS